MAEVAKGIYLEDREPSRPQSAERGTPGLQSVISIHTAESGTDMAGDDQRAESVAEFIRGRSTAGSYHLLGDSDSIIQLLDMDLQSYQSRGGSNHRVISMSLAMNAADWGKLTRPRRLQFVDTAAQMAVIGARHLQARDKPAPAARRLTKAEAFKVGASGFIDHARLDETRRKDPGAGFPWQDFFAAYSAQLIQTGGTSTVAELTDLEVAAMDLQRLLISWGANLGKTGEMGDGVDGDPGLVTVRSSLNLTRHLIQQLHLKGEQVTRIQTEAADLAQRFASAQDRMQAQAIEIEQLRSTQGAEIDPQELMVLRHRASEFDRIQGLLAQLATFLPG